MDITVHDISEWALAELKSMADSGMYKSDAALYREIGALAGLSRETVRQFHLCRKPNLSVANFDALVSAIKAAKRLRAA